MKALTLLSRAIFVMAASMAIGRLAAQPENPPVGVAVKIWARGTAFPDGDDGGVTLSGTFLSSAPGANDGAASASISSTTWGDPLSVVLGSSGYVRVEPDKVYSLDVTGWNFYGGEVNIVAPPGYRVRMDNILRSRETFDDSTTIVFEIHPVGARHPGLAGMASGIASSEIDWRVSLGALRNGGSAGDLALIDTGTRSDWAPIFTPSMLYYETPSDEVSVYRPSNIIRQIIANQVVVDVVTLSSTSYEIRCYNPTQMQGTSDPRTFTGSPYVTYRVEQGSTATTLKLTKEVRNVTDATSTFSIARTEYLFLSRQNSWPTFKWTRTDWSTSSTQAAAPTETYVDSTGTTGSRSEAVTVRVPGTTTAVTSVTRNYTVPTVGGVSVIGEVLALETVGTTSSASSSFSYYTSTSQFGSLGYLKSAVMPGGNWAAYEYYDTDIANGYQGGRIKYRYAPFLNSPSSLPTTPSTSQGEVTYHEYTNDLWGASTRSSLVQTSINGTIISRSTTAYNDSYGTANGYAIAQSTRSSYTSGSESLPNIVRYYRDDVSNKFLRGQTHSITSADGVVQAFAYQLGTWSGSVFTPAGGVGTGTASRIAVVTGSSFTSAGEAYSAIDSYAIDPIRLVAGKSTKDVTIRDSRALVVRTESHIWVASAWQLVSYTNYSYDYAARLTQRTGSNGATYTATYDGGLKTSETDEAGVTTNFTYDATGTVSIATRVGSGAIASVATRMTRDAAGRTTKQEVGYNLTSPITTQWTYDDAGRKTSETPPGSYGVVTYSYDPTNRTQTTTRADGSTIITTDYVDGHKYSVTGTGTVPEYHTHGVETSTPLSGFRWYQVNVGTSSSPRWEKSWKDWAGRPIKSEHPGFTGQPNIVEEQFYSTASNSSRGHPIKSTKTGFAATLFEYNSMAQAIRSGIDYDGSGTLDLASSDRITETDSTFETYTTNGVSGWWARTDTKTYPKLGLNTVVVTSTSRSRMTGHPTNRLSESQTIDAEGNVTTQTVDVNRSAHTSVATTTRSGIPTSMVENTLNGHSINITGFDGLTVSKTYDAFLRPSTVTDSRSNTTTTTYIAGTPMVSTVTNAASNVAVTTYDTMGRVATQRDPANYYTRYSYNLRSQVIRQWGDGTMPVEYGYDSTYGTKTSMTTYRNGTGWEGATWPSSPGTGDTTTWAYDAPSGLMTTKTDALGRAGTQTYNSRGQTATRTLARGVVTTYGYDSATGELLTQTYSDSTPAVTYTYGRTGQVETINDFTGLRDLIYDSAKPWRMTAEAESSFYGGRVLSRLYDESGTIGRVRGFQLGAGTLSNSDLEQTFGFTTVGRFETIATSRASDSATLRRFRYGYRTDSALLQSVAIDNGPGPGGHPFTISRTYETYRDVITNLESKWSTTLRTGYAYTYDERGQRSKAVQSGDAYSDYGDVTSQQFAYNGRGELTAAIGYMGSDTTLSNKQLPGRRHEYGYDTAGNRQWSNRTGVTALRDDYTTNALNQYVTRENNTVPISGTAEPDTGGAGGVAVAVQGGTLSPVAAGRQGRYWNDDVTVNNNANPVSPNPWRGPLTIFTAKRGTGGSSDAYRVDSRMAEIGAMLQTFTYDNDGNLISDGIADYQWDAENRLVRMETTVMARSWGYPHRLLEFRYDYVGRRVQKRVVDVTLNQEISCRRFLYDGWNLIAEYAAPGASVCGALLRSYTWGLDIALSMSNAGGVGALLQIADHPSGKTYLPTYDGNGNIAALINAVSGALAAAYEYSPYGEPLRAQVLDSTVTDNPFRFSTKWTDLETGLVYYGHRYFDPRNGRFINRDPIEEAGGLNLYGFCGNNPINRWDVLGHDSPGDNDTNDGPPQYDENGNLIVKKPDDNDVKVVTPPGAVGDPNQGRSWMQDGYCGDYGAGEDDGGGMSLNEIELLGRQIEEQNREAEAAERAARDAANIAALNAGFAPGLSAVSANISENLNAGIEALNTGISVAITPNAQAANQAGSDQLVQDLQGSTFRLSPTGSATTSGGASAVSDSMSSVSASASVNPAVTSSTSTGAATDPSGAPSSGSAIVTYWGPGDQGFGHVSLTLDNGTYISNWPDDNNMHMFGGGTTRPSNYTSDRNEEGFDPQSVTVRGINTSAVQDWWDNRAPVYSGLTNNCSDTVIDALRIGGRTDIPTQVVADPKETWQDINAAIAPRLPPALGGKPPTPPKW